MVNASAEVPFVCVDVKATLQQDPAEPEVVASHGRVGATVECCSVKGSEGFPYECTRGNVIEQPPAKATLGQRSPAVDALQYVWGNICRIVPKLDHHPRDRRAEPA